MSQASTSSRQDHRTGHRFSFKNLLIRVWSLIIMLVVVGTAVMAVVYMIRYVFQPAVLPTWVRQGQPALQTEASWSDLIAGSAGIPMSHYHRVGVWIRPDLTDNCTASDCHSALPHNRSKETRAFANMHATFVACELCHDKTITDPVQAVWLDKTTGQPRNAPAALLLMRQLEVDAEKIENNPAAEHAIIVERLSTLLNNIGPDPLLEYLLVRMNTAEPGSPVWQSTVSRLSQEVTKYVKGEYGAKLALARDDAERGRQRDRLSDLTRQFCKAAKDSPQQRALSRLIHEPVLAEPIGCVACHGGKTCRIDYTALGYPPSRQQALRHLPVAMLIQHNRQGQPFYLPGIVDQPAATRPAQR